MEMFKAQKETKRFRKNQKVWIRQDFANFVMIRFKWRGKGRYVNGLIAKYDHNGSPSKVVGPYIECDVTEDFANRILGNLRKD